LHAAMAFPEWVFGTFIIAVLCFIALRGWQLTRKVAAPSLRDLEVGALMGVAAYATVLYTDGDLDGTYYPLVYVAVGVTSAFARPLSSLGVILLMMLFELVVRELVYGGLEPQALLPHMGFAMVFGLLNTVSLRMEVARLRKASRHELAAERERIRDDARSYRLLRAPRGAEDDCDEQSDEERLLRSGVEQIQMSLLFALRMLRESLGLHTAVLLWLGDDGQTLRISELVTAAADVTDGPFSAADGVFGAVLSRQQPVAAVGLSDHYFLPYYRSAVPVQSVCAVPVYEHGSVRGVLVADRLEAATFSDEETQLLLMAAQFAARAIDNERVFVQLERTKVEQGKLYRAAERLAAAMSEQEVVDAGVCSASEIASVDFAALTSFDAATGRHRIIAVKADEAVQQQLMGKCFKQDKGLVGMALRNRHPLPYRGKFEVGRQVVFAPELSLPALPSLWVVPLVSHEQPLGTLVLGSRERYAFHDTARRMLEVLANQVAVSLANAKMVQRLEEQATTDGMTGLLNKRAMYDHAAERLVAAKRFGRQLSVLVADIDLFKKVNDTYGHDVGDTVIKELAAIHERNKRDTDAVARFGGEEFVTIFDDTDAAGALLLAQRIRDELRNTTFHAGGKTFHCTCSIGIATFPCAGSDWEGLFKAADTALYES
ncbi:MAG TPA: diguanylate cyclase, partial [Sorangium sp.]|nr:diguanylate cyclase [Sorangium sp.]